MYKLGARHTVQATDADSWLGCVEDKNSGEGLSFAITMLPSFLLAVAAVMILQQQESQ